jgi:nucleotide-binding universal stress UspA family protein
MRRALLLARALGARLDVVHVIDDDLPADLAAEKRRVAEQALTRALAGPEAAGVETGIAVLEGHPAAVIAREAEARDALLVITGQHRARPFLDMLRETTVERMVRAIARPVLLVAAPAEAPYAKVLVPVAFSPACATAVRMARDIAPGATMHLFHAVHVPFAGLMDASGQRDVTRTVLADDATACDRWQSDHHLPADLAQPEIVAGGFGTLMADRVARLRPDLIALGAHTRSGLSLFTLGGTAAELLRDPPCDLLLARPA